MKIVTKKANQEVRDTNMLEVHVGNTRDVNKTTAGLTDVSLI
jgi:ATP-binding cassette, subfamily B (MDR/TAP), member 1